MDQDAHIEKAMAVQFRSCSSHVYRSTLNSTASTRKLILHPHPHHHPQLPGAQRHAHALPLSRTGLPHRSPSSLSLSLPPSLPLFLFLFLFSFFLSLSSLSLPLSFLLSLSLSSSLSSSLSFSLH